MGRVGHWRDASRALHFRIFAPLARTLALELPESGRVHPMSPGEHGAWTLTLEDLPDGTLYQLILNGEARPDPASRRQPFGVHGPSAISTPRKPDKKSWSGIPLDQAIIYEIHIGTFTPEGDLAALRRKLPYLKDLGVNVLELMPIAAFPGQRNWGYDGVFPFALQSSYGSYEDLTLLIESAHELGIAVVLDIVHNHLGPEGNYSNLFAPYTRRADTPWGAAINFDEAWSFGVREFFLENIRYWLEDLGFDGLRMDAVSLIFDNSPLHILTEATELAHAIGAREGRKILMIAEHLRNNRYVTRDSGFGFDAQWSDDLTHAVFACLTGETQRHYINHGSFDDVARALSDGFVLNGQRFDHYYKTFMGTEGRDLPGESFIVYGQNHDQVGNRPYGDRMIARYGRDRALLALTTAIASSFTPMLWMGDEFGESAEFYFFEDFGDPALVAAVKNGRMSDFAIRDGELPDPHSLESFQRSKLNWSLLASREGQDIFQYIRALLQRKAAGLIGPRQRSALRVEALHEQRIIVLHSAQSLTALNFSDQPRALEPRPGWSRSLCSVNAEAEWTLPPFAAAVYEPIAAS